MNTTSPLQSEGVSLFLSTGFYVCSANRTALATNINVDMTPLLNKISWDVVLSSKEVGMVVSGERLGGGRDRGGGGCRMGQRYRWVGVDILYSG
jgi:hypothetical protein